MKLKKLTPRKSRAQAMVEFAIALPILLMLLYGILEAGRLLFLYSTVVTATRQAVRYGSATGVGSDGVTPRYRDCAGIRNAADRVDFLRAFDHTSDDIEIYHDTGPSDLSPVPYCTSMAPDTTFGPTNSSRIKVVIKADFFPIVPRLVPFFERSRANNDPITGVSARTILVSIVIAVTNTPNPATATPSNTASPSPSASPTETATATATDTPLATDTPSQTPTMTLSPTATLSPTVTLTPTITDTPTITPSPTLSPTPVAGCNSTNIRAGTLQKSGSSMSLVITNDLTTPIEVKDIFVIWNHNNGAQGNQPLRLISVSWEPTIWNGPPSSGPSLTIIPSPTTYVQPGASTLTFTFSEAYVNWEKKNEDTPERVTISFATSGCTSFTIDVQRTP